MKIKKRRLHSKASAVKWLVETGESRTHLLSIADISKSQSDPTTLLIQLLNQILALGQSAQQLRQALSHNGHQQHEVAEIVSRFIKGGNNNAP